MAALKELLAAFAIIICLASPALSALDCDKVPDRINDVGTASLAIMEDEYEQGKRDDRDGFIVINQLLFGYLAQHQEKSPEARRLAALRAALYKKHPDFLTMGNWQLSETIACQKAAEDAEAEERRVAENWIPPDSVPLHIFTDGQHLAAVFQFKISFFDLPKGFKIKISDRPIVVHESKEVRLTTLKAIKTYTFKRSIDIGQVLGSAADMGSFLVCTSLLGSGYVAMTDSEKAALRPLKHNDWKPWISPEGQFENFCGVMAVDGKILHQFKITETPPQRIISPVGSAERGTKVAIIVGEKVDGEDAPFIGNPHELWIWKSPNIVKKIEVSPDTNITVLFLNGKLWDYIPK